MEEAAGIRGSTAASTQPLLVFAGSTKPKSPAGDNGNLDAAYQLSPVVAANPAT